MLGSTTKGRLCGGWREAGNAAGPKGPAVYFYDSLRTTRPSEVQRRNDAPTSAVSTRWQAGPSSPSRRAACAGVNRSPGISVNSDLTR